MAEHVPHTYFSKLYNRGSVAIRGSTLDGYDLYAVSIPHPDFGVLTAYFASPGEDADATDFELFAYDAFCPFSQDTFTDCLYPDDIVFFSG